MTSDHFALQIDRYKKYWLQDNPTVLEAASTRTHIDLEVNHNETAGIYFQIPVEDKSVKWFILICLLLTGLWTAA